MSRSLPSSNELVDEGNVRRVVVKQRGKTIAEFPLTAGVIGAVIAPVAAAIGALSALMAECTIEVEKTVDEPESTTVPWPGRRRFAVCPSALKTAIFAGFETPAATGGALLPRKIRASPTKICATGRPVLARAQHEGARHDMSRKGRYLFTSESVTEGHPDKIADQISDSILDAILAQDPVGRVACETLVTTGLAIIAGEITTSCYVDFPKIVRETIKDVGYTRGEVRLRLRDLRRAVVDPRAVARHRAWASTPAAPATRA